MQLSLKQCSVCISCGLVECVAWDCRIWGSEEDPHFPVDSFLFTKSLDIVGACTTEVVEIKGREYLVKTFIYIAIFVVAIKGLGFTLLRWVSSSLS